MKRLFNSSLIWWGDYTMRAMVRRELLERKGDPERRKSWEAAAPGLHFSPDWCHKAEKKLEGSVCSASWRSAGSRRGER
ncbi:MAG: hypothetical protein IPJ88_04960 [Myxococcales bacterium]|nr:MAG: hypothetical protein IPJ88_04960 [Myxococcales bacterium]